MLLSKRPHAQPPPYWGHGLAAEPAAPAMLDSRLRAREAYVAVAVLHALLAAAEPRAVLAMLDLRMLAMPSFLMEDRGVGAAAGAAGAAGVHVSTCGPSWRSST